MKHYLENIDEVCRDVKTGVDGITSQEAESRLESNGKNKLAEGKKEPIILRLLKQFIEPMTLILIVAAIISGILTAVNNSSGGKKEFPSDVIIIMRSSSSTRFSASCRRARRKKPSTRCKK